MASRVDLMAPCSEERWELRTPKFSTSSRVGSSLKSAITGAVEMLVDCGLTGGPTAEVEQQRVGHLIQLNMQIWSRDIFLHELLCGDGCLRTHERVRLFDRSLQS